MVRLSPVTWNCAKENQMVRVTPRGLVGSVSYPLPKAVCLGRWIEVSLLAGHDFPNRNHQKNNYPGKVRPASSFLELFVIYHSSPRKLILRCYRVGC
jgi:hypothetical protein